MKVIKPKRLRHGDTIAIVSPASPSLTTIYYDRGKSVLERAGFNVVEGRHINDRNLLFAGDEKSRADDINRAFGDKSIRAIICTRGGSGTLHILPYIDFSMIEKNPKIFIGYSDITALQIAMFNKTRLITFYGPMVATDLGKGFTKYTRDNFFNILGETGQEIELKNPHDREIITICPGKAQGQLMGGCFSIVVATLGTEYEIDTKDKILFFEDIDEKPHRVDRYLTQLILAGKLEHVKGIIFGTFQKCRYYTRDNYYKYGVTLLDIIKNKVEPLGIPTIYGLQFGHVINKLTIPVGVYATLDATNGRVTVEPAVV
jgi:muramoyltetrapeptide carboxypeptidase